MFTCLGTAPVHITPAEAERGLYHHTDMRSKNNITEVPYNISFEFDLFLYIFTKYTKNHIPFETLESLPLLTSKFRLHFLHVRTMQAIPKTNLR